MQDAFSSLSDDELILSIRLLESAPDAILLVDAVGTIVLANSQAETLFGYPRSKLVGQSIEMLLPPHLRHRHKDHRASYAEFPRLRRMAAGQSLTARRQDNSEFPVEVSLSPLKTAREQLVIAFVRDVTERHRLELLERQQFEERAARAAAERLSTQLQRLQALTAAFSEAVTTSQVVQVLIEQGVRDLGALAGSVVLPTEEGQTLRVEQAVGYSDEVLASYHTFPLNAPLPLAEAVRLGESIWVPSLEAWVRRYSPTGQGGYPSRGRAWAAIPLIAEGRVLGGLGLSFAKEEPFTLEARSLILNLAHHAAQALARTRLYEVAQQARIEAEAARQHLALLAEATQGFAEAGLAVEAVLEVAAHIVAREVGDACLIRLLSSDGERLNPVALAHRNSTALALLQTLFAQPHQLGEGFISHIFQSGEVLYLPEVDPALLRQGLKAEYLPYLEHHTIRSLIVVPLTAREQRLGALAAWRDQSRLPYQPEELTLLQALAARAALAIDNARLYQEAQAALQLRDQFLSVASHELKTPLTVVQGYADMLHRRAVQSGMAERDLYMVQTMRVEARRLHRLIELLLDVSRLQQGRLELEHKPVNLVTLLRHLIEVMSPSYSDHALSFHAPDSPVIVTGDALRLEQIFQNLLSNAVKYSPQGGEVMVRLDPQATTLRVMVSDQGIGIDPGALGSLFQRFYRADNARRLGIPGLGLGLYVVRSFVEAHHGSIQIQSQPEEGTTFIVTLPLAAAE